MTFYIFIWLCDHYLYPELEHYQFPLRILSCPLQSIPSQKVTPILISTIIDEFSYLEMWSHSVYSFLATWCKEPTHWKRPWCWERLRTGGEEGNRGWDSWMASPTWWTWVWANSGSCRWTGKPGVLQSMGSQSQTCLRDWSELNWRHLYWDIIKYTLEFTSICLMLYQNILPMLQFFLPFV